MADTFGDSFSPLQPPPGGPGGPPNGSFGGGSASPIQDAIKVLSLRIPRVAGASALAPMGLLNSPGGSMFGGGSLQQILQQIFGRRAQAGPVASMPMPSPQAANPAFKFGGGGPGQGGGNGTFDPFGGNVPRPMLPGPDRPPNPGLPGLGGPRKL